MIRRSLLAVVLALAAAGCGGAEATSGSSAAAVAGIVPASTPILVAVDTNPGSDQWKRADGLLSRFPARDKILSELSASVKGQGLDLRHDLIPALGDETYLAVTTVQGTHGDVVVLTKPRDPKALRALLQKTKEPTVTRELDGWTAIAHDAATLDRFAAPGGKLDGADWFADAQGSVEDGALVTVFANGDAVSKSVAASAGTRCDSARRKATLRFAVGTLHAEDAGVRFGLSVKSEGAPKLAQSDSLRSSVPSGAFVYLGSPGLDAAGLGLTEQLRCLLDANGAGGVEKVLGVDLEQVLDLFAGGFGLYGRPAGLIPEATLLLAPKDAARGLQTLDTLAGKLGVLVGSPPRATTVGPTPAKELRLGPVSILYGADGGHIAITTARAGIEALAGGGDSLDDDAAFKRARDAAGAKGDDEVFAYLDLQRLVGLADDVAGLSGTRLSAETRANLEPLRSFVGFGNTHDPNDVELGAFLEIR